MSDQEENLNGFQNSWRICDKTLTACVIFVIGQYLIHIKILQVDDDVVQG